MTPKRLSSTGGKVFLGISPLLLLAVAYGAIEGTSSQSFCNQCHEIQPAVESWKVSPHGMKEGKVLASCRDCHLPGWDEPMALAKAKLDHGINDVRGHFSRTAEFDQPTFYWELKDRARAKVTDSVCLKCHADIKTPEKDVVQSEFGEVRGLHSSKAATEVTCLTCHKNTGHQLWR